MSDDSESFIRRHVEVILSMRMMDVSEADVDGIVDYIVSNYRLDDLSEEGLIRFLEDGDSFNEAVHELGLG